MFRVAWQMAKDTWSEFSDDNGFRLAAALAYYTGLALAPLLLVVISIAGIVFGQQAARGEVVDQIKGMVGDQGAEAIQTMLSDTEALTRRVDGAEQRSAEAMDHVGAEVSRAAGAIDARLGRAETAQAEALERLSGEIARITESLGERIGHVREPYRLEPGRQADGDDQGAVAARRQGGHRPQSARSTSRTSFLPLRTTQNRSNSGGGSGAAGSVIRSSFT